MQGCGLWAALRLELRTTEGTALMKKLILSAHWGIMEDIITHDS